MPPSALPTRHKSQRAAAKRAIETTRQAYEEQVNTESQHRDDREEDPDYVVLNFDVEPREEYAYHPKSVRTRATNPLSKKGRAEMVEELKDLEMAVGELPKKRKRDNVVYTENVDNVDDVNDEDDKDDEETDMWGRPLPSERQKKDLSRYRVPAERQEQQPKLKSQARKSVMNREFGGAV